DTTPGELGENQIRIDGEVYEAQGGYFTVFGNTTTGEILGTYTWPAEELGLEKDLLVSEWSSAQVVTNGGTQYLLVTMFDVPYVVSNTLPTVAPNVISYQQRLYEQAGTTWQVMYESDNIEEFASFDTFVLGQFGQTQEGEPAHEVANYDFETAFGFVGVSAAAQFKGTNSLLYVEAVSAGKGTKAERFDRVINSFDMNRVK